jgi:hypothetical protein
MRSGFVNPAFLFELAAESMDPPFREAPGSIELSAIQVFLEYSVALGRRKRC